MRARAAVLLAPALSYTWASPWLRRGSRMQHRHLDHQRFTPAAIDDLIARGKWHDWVQLRAAVLQDPALLDSVQRVCLARTADPYAQRHHFWMHYAEEHRAAS